jgi:KDO2-lipid IV(A) lauroyltransferase
MPKARTKARRRFPGSEVVEYLLLRGLAGILNSLPLACSHWLSRKIGDLLFVAGDRRRGIALDNLSIAYGDSLTIQEKERLARESMRNLVTSLMELSRIPAMLSRVEGRFEFEGTEVLDRAFARGKGVIAVISHLGSWEYLGFLPYLRGYPCSVVVRGTSNPYISRWIERLRLATTLSPIPRKHSIRQVLSELQKNHLVAFLTDQWAGHRAIVVDFFGKPTATTSIPARLARKTGAALVPGYCLRTAPGRYKILIKPEVSIDWDHEDWEHVVTRKLNHVLEHEIRRHPEQWIWTHRRWKGSEY